MQAYKNLVGKTYWVKTFGCQMNLHDSERVSGLLDSCGCVQVATADDADIVVYMTCCVRENADTRLYGQVSAMVSAPKPPSGKRIVAIGGCIAQRDGDRIRNNIPNADVVFGTSALSSLPGLLDESISNNKKSIAVDIDENKEGFSTDLPSSRAQRFHAWVPIMTGCNNFCTYCIVPYVRGREKSRTMESILAECARYVEDGVREITLLGQNVNSYGRDLYGSPRFAELLKEVGNTGIERLRFTSSNPKDLNRNVIDAMAQTECVMPHLHLAVQSGSNRVLKAMNRHYTRESYMQLAQDLKAAMPQIALTTDIIVGFPGETASDFEDTMYLVREVGFSSAYTFIYSKRPGTPAAKIVDPTSREVIQERFDRLAALVAQLAHESNGKDLGKTVEVLVEGVSKRSCDVLTGHSRKNQTVHFELPATKEVQDFVGHMVDVKVDEARTWYLSGTAINEPR